MDKDYEVPFAEILVTYEKLVDLFEDAEDTRVVLSACLIFIAKCNVALCVKPTEIEEFWEMARPVVLHYMDVFQKKSV